VKRGESFAALQDDDDDDAIRYHRVRICRAHIGYVRN